MSYIYMFIEMTEIERICECAFQQVVFFHVEYQKLIPLVRGSLEDIKSSVHHFSSTVSNTTRERDLVPLRKFVKTSVDFLEGSMSSLDSLLIFGHSMADLLNSTTFALANSGCEETSGEMARMVQTDCMLWGDLDESCKLMGEVEKWAQFMLTWVHWLSKVGCGRN